MNNSVDKAVKTMMKKYKKYKETFGDLHQRVIHPDIGEQDVSW